jgi:hypothetical protein
LLFASAYDTLSSSLRKKYRPSEKWSGMRLLLIYAPRNGPNKIKEFYFEKLYIKFSFRLC